MTEQKFDMKSALRYAIHSEYHASVFYRQWAEQVSGAGGRSLAIWPNGKTSTVGRFRDTTPGFSGKK